MDFIVFCFILIIFLAHISYYREYDIVGTLSGYGVRESQIIFGYPIYQEVIKSGLTYKEAVKICNKLNQM